MTEPIPAIHIKDLTKRYGPPASGQLALDRISLDVPTGEVFGFLGPNGAGKTTTIRILTGLTRPTAGHVKLLGMDIDRDLPRIKKRIGVVPETSNLYDELSAFDNLIFAMRLYGVPRRERVTRATELLARFRLTEQRDKPFARLSRGMKRALTIAAALAHRPQVVFLDEPTTGLDVVSARNLRRMIAGLRDEGITVFLTTHYLEEAERLCDRIALIVRGRIVALDTVEGLRAQVQDFTAVEAALEAEGGDVRVRRVVGDSVASLVRGVLEQAQAENQHLLSVNTIRPSLEDVFVQLTGLDAEVMQIDKGGKGK